MGSPAEDEEIRAPGGQWREGRAGPQWDSRWGCGFLESESHTRTHPAGTGGGAGGHEEPGPWAERPAPLEQGGPVPRAQGRDGKGL